MVRLPKNRSRNFSNDERNIQFGMVIIPMWPLLSQADVAQLDETREEVALASGSCP